MVLDFLNELTQAGYRIFDISDATEVAETLGIKKRTVHYILRALCDKKMIRHLYRGTYAIEDNILSGSPINKFEIAMHVSRGGAIGCWSAMAFYELTDQVLTKVFVFAPAAAGKKRKDYLYTIDGYDFQLIQIQPEDLWGVDQKRILDIKANITNLERTLIDGLTYPQYCGGFREVLNAFAVAKDRIDINKLLYYSEECSIALQKRVGWILSSLGFENLEALTTQTRTNYYHKLDPLGPRRGKQNKRWMLLENF